jgi:hypothetical protein
MAPVLMNRFDHKNRAVQGTDRGIGHINLLEHNLISRGQLKMYVYKLENCKQNKMFIKYLRELIL